MVSRLCAIVLVVLTILPFTAPFSVVGQPGSNDATTARLSMAISDKDANDAAVTPDASLHRHFKFFSLTIAAAPHVPRLVTPARCPGPSAASPSSSSSSTRVLRL